jgi:hypothetical protein
MREVAGWIEGSLTLSEMTVVRHGAQSNTTRPFRPTRISTFTEPSGAI